MNCRTEIKLPVKNKKGISLILSLVICICFAVNTSIAQTQTAVQKYGALTVSGNKIVDKNGGSVSLRGMSLYWSQWQPRFYNYNTIKWLRDDWKVTVIRAAMAVDAGGYATNPTAERDKIYTVIDACINLGIYVIVDFHAHEANNYLTQARTFFGDVSRKYGNSPNIIYEPWNEPRDVSWAGVIKPYHENIVDVIRANASNALIICGTRFYSQEVGEAAANPVNRSNIAYTLHFYANTHKQELRNKAQTAINSGKALFVTEYGTNDASADGYVNEAETNTWWSFLDNNSIGYCNWSVADVPESGAILNTTSAGVSNWTSGQLKPSGTFVRNMLRSKAPNLSTATIANGTYRITARHSGLSLNVEGNNTGDGGNVVQWPYGGGGNEKWFIQSTGAGFYSIKNVNSGKSLDVSGNNIYNSTDINQWTYYGSLNQKWRIENEGNGYYRIVSANSNKCIDVNGANTAQGTPISQYTCFGSNNQQFTFSQLSGATALAANPRTATPATEETAIKVNVYPNPSASTFIINQAELVSYRIFNASGALMEKGQGNGKNNIAVGKKLVAGIYLLEVKTKKGSGRFKLIKE